MKIDEAHRNVQSASFLHFFCLSANIGTPPTPSPASVSPPGTKGEDTLTCGLSGWGPNSDDWRESLSLCLLCGPVDWCVNILAHRCPPPPIGNDDQARCANNFFFLAEYKEDACVRSASPIFMPIAYKLSLTNRKRKYVAEKTTGPLKSKQTLITTVRYPILSVDKLPTPLIFRYTLPLKLDKSASL
jgi:hypothetical protein